MRALATAAGAFALVLAVLLAAVAQLGKIDLHTETGRSAEPCDGAGAAPLSLDLSVLRRFGRDEVAEQVLREVRNLVDGTIECRLVRL